MRDDIIACLKKYSVCSTKQIADYVGRSHDNVYRTLCRLHEEWIVTCPDWFLWKLKQPKGSE